MKRLRTRVRLTARDWQRIYDALELVPGPASYGALLTSRKIGAGGMAARNRGVAPVRKGKR